MYKKAIWMSSLIFSAFATSPLSYAQTVFEPRFCPDTLSDTDGDGWGEENNRPCRVLKSARDLPICSSVVLHTDSDKDGWGWDSSTEETCLVDNTSVVNEFVITDSSGKVTIGQNIPPIVTSYVKPLGHFNSGMEISSDGILYHYRVPDQMLAATTGDGETLWEVEMFRSYVAELDLDQSEETLYAVLSQTQRIAAYSKDGEYLWESERLGRIASVDLGQDAIIAVLRSDDDPQSSQPFSVVSLNYDGTLRWKFRPGPTIDYALGRDDRVYIKWRSEPYGNEVTHILAQ